MSRIGMVACLAMTGMLLVACDEKPGDLATFVADLRSGPTRAVEDLPETERYEPFTYATSGMRAPFAPASRDLQAPDGPTPDLARKREPLESYPLSSLQMVGTVSVGNDFMALVQTPESKLFRVRAGDFIGVHNGRVVAITQNGLFITELVKDGSGAYRRRASSLRIDAL